MNDWSYALDFFMKGAMLLLMTLGLGVAVVMPGIEQWSRRFFIIFFAVLTLFILLYLINAINAIFYGNPNIASAAKIVYCLESALVSVPVPMMTVYLLHCRGENPCKSALFRGAFALWILYLILLTVARFTSFLYYITPDNRFCRGSWYPFITAPLTAIMLLNITGVILSRNKLSKKNFYALLICLIPLTVAIFLYTFVPLHWFVDIALFISALSVFGLILSEQIEQYLRQQREIARQRANIMVLQMRPHFIYNTMMSIYCLCNQDPKKARQVTMDFTTYLRKNFTAIACENTIPFSEELEHARAYLSVERVQFEDSLFIDYDTPHIRFRVPPLTLQPIVENAVKHGLDPDSAPLHISIRTRETDFGSEILVEDDGPGYEPADDHEPHIALANIRQRLKMMCGGKMTIMPREGGGTVLKVIIPRQ